MAYKEVRAKTGEDKDGKPFYKTIGRVMDTKAGPMLKLDTIPLQWDGWAYISEPKPVEGAQRTHGQRRGGPQDDQDSPPF